jgi:hypothetical protein
MILFLLKHNFINCELCYILILINTISGRHILAHKDRNMVYAGGYTRQTEILEVRDKRTKVLGSAMGK